MDEGAIPSASTKRRLKLIQRLANKIGIMHAKFFMFLSQKAKSNIFWTLVLTIWTLYEIFEHIALPTIAVLWGAGKISF